MKNGAKWQVQTITTQKKRLIGEINSIGGDPCTLTMWRKGVGLAVKVQKAKPAAANIIKQEAIASGIDAVVSRGTVSCAPDYTDVLILGSVRGMAILSERLKRQGFSLPFLAYEMDKLLANECHTGVPVLKMRERALLLDKPRVMGILNVTPDSFSDGGRYCDAQSVADRAAQIFDEGGIFVDVGGVSTRPGFTAVPLEEELKRVLPAVDAVVKIATQYNGFVSVDTMRAKVAEKSLELGVDLINDQTALKSPRMRAVCAASGGGVCLMHNPVRPGADRDPMSALNETKQRCVQYAEKAISAGVSAESIVIDPGFGFGKSFEDAYCILQYLSELCNLGYPVLVGVSRKSMLGAATGRNILDRAYATVAAETIAAMNGAALIRTHHVAACADALHICDAVKGVWKK